MARRYGNYRLSDKSRSGGGLWWKLLVALIIGALFWLRYHHCEHPVFNPAEPTDEPAVRESASEAVERTSGEPAIQQDAPAANQDTDEAIEHPPVALP